ncbi:MAG: RNA 3'-terminal phosphate cyclase [Methanomassiliicoccales archaeon]
MPNSSKDNSTPWRAETRLEAEGLIEVDGARGEGGGQIIRTSVALSSLIGQETRICNIRAGRPNPGLQAQHVCAIEGVARLCDAVVKGNRVGSTEILFSPGRVKPGQYKMSVGTAGSVTLVLQACLLASARTPQPFIFEVMGGTNVRWSPPIDFYELTLFPQLERMGARCALVEMKRGFYPEGGGRAVVRWEPPSRFLPLNLERRGGLKHLKGRVFTQNLPEHVAQRMAAAFRKSFLGANISLYTERSLGDSTGAGIFILADFENCLLSADGLGERGVPAEKVGEDAAQALKKEIHSAATVDAHAADQLLPFMALAEDESRVVVREITGHLQSQADLMRRFLNASIDFEPIDRGVLLRVKPQPYI